MAICPHCRNEFIEDGWYYDLTTDIRVDRQVVTFHSGHCESEILRRFGRRAQIVGMSKPPPAGGF